MIPHDVDAVHQLCVGACELLRAQAIRARVATDDRTSVGFTNIVIPKSYTTNSYHQVLGKEYTQARRSVDELAAYIKAEETRRIAIEFAHEETTTRS